VAVRITLRKEIRVVVRIVVVVVKGSKQ